VVTELVLPFQGVYQSVRVPSCHARDRRDGTDRSLRQFQKYSMLYE
jgi:hypothetical protein